MDVWSLLSLHVPLFHVWFKQYVKSETSLEKGKNKARHQQNSLWGGFSVVLKSGCTSESSLEIF